MRKNILKLKKAPPESGSLADRAYVTIRNRILKGDYAFGDILSRRRVARELKMSLVPVSEALQKLEHDGLVERRPRAGTRVRIPAPDEIRGLYEVREALESQAARLCALHATAAERAELRAGAGELDRLFSENGSNRGGRERLFRLHSRHVRLHTAIAECARCKALSEAIERNHVLVFNFLYDVAARRMVLPPSFHRELIEAIIRGTPEEADAAMRSHVRYGLSETLLRLEPQIRQSSWRLRRNA